MTLVVLDMDHTLIDTYIISKKTINAHIDDYMYDYIYEENDNLIKISVRPHVLDFLQKLVNLGDKLAIYSNGSSNYVNKCIEIAFNQIPWYFIWTRDSMPTPQLKKDLRLITQNYPEFNTNNIVFIDDQLSTCHNNKKLGYKCICVIHYDITKKFFDKLFWGDYMISHITKN